MVGASAFWLFCRILVEKMQRDPRTLKVLDVGCGGGLLAEEFARLGCQVTGIDPSQPSLDTARQHAAASGLAITYQSGVGEQFRLLMVRLILLSAAMCWSMFKVLPRLSRKLLV